MNNRCKRTFSYILYNDGDDGGSNSSSSGRGGGRFLAVLPMFVRIFFLRDAVCLLFFSCIFPLSLNEMMCIVRLSNQLF